jgi:hypothetical protein
MYKINIRKIIQKTMRGIVAQRCLPISNCCKSNAMKAELQQ